MFILVMSSSLINSLFGTPPYIESYNFKEIWEFQNIEWFDLVKFYNFQTTVS